MQYKIVTAEDEFGSIRKVEREVNALIKDGWKPLGGISIINSGTYTIRVSQAMIKED